MSLETHLPEEDLVLFALQLLPEERMRVAMSHVQVCQQCRTEIAKIQGDLAAYSTTAEPVAPPPGARDRVMRQIAREPRLEEIQPIHFPPPDVRPAETRPIELRPAEPRLADRRSTDPRPAEPRFVDLQPAESASLENRSADSRPPETLSLLPDSRYADQEPALPPRPSAPTRPERNGTAFDSESRGHSRASDEPMFAPRGDRESAHEFRREPEEPALTPRPVREPDEPLTPHPGRAADEPVFAARQSRIFGSPAREEEREDHFEERRHPRRAPWILAGTGWAVAIGCSFLAGLQLHQRQQMQGTMAAQQAKIDDLQKQTAPAEKAQTALSTLTSANAMQVALHAPPAAKPASAVKGAPPVIPPEALAAYLANKGALVFVATHMQPAPAGKTYELWLLPANGQSPIPAGTFKPDSQGSASVVMPKLPAGVQAKGFGVTVENDGGSQTPTLPIIMS